MMFTQVLSATSQFPFCLGLTLPTLTRLEVWESEEFNSVTLPCLLPVAGDCARDTDLPCAYGARHHRAWDNVWRQGARSEATQTETTHRRVRLDEIVLKHV